MVWTTLLGSLLGKAGGSGQQAQMQVEEQPVAQMAPMQESKAWTPEHLQQQERKRRQQPFSVLSGMTQQDMGGYY